MCLLPQGEHQDEHILILCNAIGSPVDSKVIELEPKYVCLTGDCPALCALTCCKVAVDMIATYGTNERFTCATPRSEHQQAKHARKPLVMPRVL